MLWTPSSEKMLKDKVVSSGGCIMVGGQKLLLAVLLATGILVIAGYYYVIRQPGDELHPIIKFEDKFKEVCAKPKLPMMSYKGVESFFEYLSQPETDFCYSWIEFGGEKLPVANQTEEECNDEVRKAKYMCFNEEYKMNLDPCLMYSFVKDFDSQFERDMHLFSCEVHAFDAAEVTAGEHVQRTEFWYEHSWDISEFPYDLPAAENPAKNGRSIMRRSLDFIIGSLAHKGREIKFLKSDLMGREWMLLRQIIINQDLADVRQIGVRIHLPSKTRTMSEKERHDTYQKLFQVFQGLACTGYRYVLSRPVKYYKGGIHVPEMNKTFFPAYEVNFAKDLNIVA